MSNYEEIMSLIDDHKEEDGWDPEKIKKSVLRRLAQYDGDADRVLQESERIIDELQNDYGVVNE